LTLAIDPQMPQTLALGFYSRYIVSELQAKREDS
jgi:hypothetical protein